ncbi:MAG: DUF106 domain-containing protein [Thaumarchaeota archaeon]|nr:DUF106 domain-containing protein [Nitrososphaerota archaeon]
MTNTASVVLAALIVLSLTAVPAATAQGGLEVSLSTTCVITNPGGNSTVLVSVSWGSQPGATPLTLAAIGSIPKDSNISIAPISGSAPLNATLVIRVAHDDGTLGSYQLGVVAKTESQEKVATFTLHVVKANSTGPGTTCSQVGLPLPDSTYVVVFTSLGLGLLTQVVTRKFVNLNKERAMKAEVAAFNKEKKEATASGDKAKLEKIKKRELPMKQAQAKVSLARSKVTLITIAPLFGVYYLMATFLGGYGVIVALSPVQIPLIVGANGEMVLIWWYFLSSFTFSSILTRLLHTTT